VLSLTPKKKGGYKKEKEKTEKEMTKKGHLYSWVERDWDVAIETIEKETKPGSK